MMVSYLGLTLFLFYNLISGALFWRPDNRCTGRSFCPSLHLKIAMNERVSFVLRNLFSLFLYTSYLARTLLKEDLTRTIFCFVFTTGTYLNATGTSHNFNKCWPRQILANSCISIGKTICKQNLIGQEKLTGTNDCK